MCRVEPIPRPSRLSLPEFSSKSLADKTTVNGEVWLCYDGVVYEVSQSWIDRHPGGSQTILSLAGQDATAYIRAMHSPKTAKLIKSMMKKVGTYQPEKEEAPVDEAEKRNRAIEQDFKELHEYVLEKGWFTKSVTSYFFDALRLVSFFGLAMYLLLWSHSAWSGEEETASYVSQKMSIIIGSMFLGVYFQNVAFFGHDAGHNAIMSDIDSDFWVGLFFGNIFSGIGISWWKSSHNCHHVNTNHLQNDPNVQHVPLFCFDKKMAEDHWSNYHGRKLSLGSIGKDVIQYQQWYFYPIMGVARLNLYAQCIKHLVMLCPFRIGRQYNGDGWQPRITKKAWILEVAGLAIFYSWMGAMLYSLGASDGFLCVVVSHFTAGILHVQILLSHVVMDYCMEHSNKLDDGNVAFYEWQALSTMDISCPAWFDWFHGGLQFQLEHHLFPCVHRYNLRKLMPFVDEIFAKYDIPVVRMGFLEGNMLLMRHMTKMGKLIASMKAPKDKSM